MTPPSEFPEARERRRRPISFPRASAWILGLVLVCAWALARSATWEGSVDLHTGVEGMAATLAAIVGVLSLVRYYAQKEPAFLLIGAGFLGAALMDAYHAAVTSPSLAAELPSLPESVSPWSWMASRMFLAVLLVIAWIADRRRTTGSVAERERREWVVYAGVGTLVAACVAFFGLVPLPSAYFEEIALQRPQEVVPGILFAIALGGFWRAGYWRRDTFHLGLLGSLVVAVAVQFLFIPLSDDLYDPMFDAGHLLKIGSYGLVLAGLVGNVHHLFARLQGARDQLTEKKRELEATLDEAESRRRVVEALLENLPVGVFLVEAPSGRPVLLNRAGAELLGRGLTLNLDRYSYHEVYETVREDGSPYPPDEFPLVEALVGGRTVVKTDVCARQPSGRIVPLKVTASPITDARDGIVQAVVVFEDISRQRELDRAKDDFVALASHQLRTPATGVKAFLSMLLDGDAGELSEIQREFVSQAHESNEHGLRLIEDLLAVTRIDAGRFVLRAETVDLTRLIAELSQVQEKEIQARGQMLRVSTKNGGTSETPVRADPVKLRMALGNLVENASKYSKQGGTIEIALDMKDTEVRISVRDEGIGIDPGDRDRLFQRFSRIHSPRSGEVGGSGLGLYLVRQIAELHGGEVEVDSEPDRGSTFTIVLPRRDP